METQRGPEPDLTLAADGTRRGLSPGSRGTRFGPGHTRRTGRRKPDEMPALLRDMRRVARTDASKDRTEMHRRLRKLFDEDFKGFVAQQTSLERAYLQGQGKAEGPPPPGGGSDPEPQDPGEERARQLIHSLLEECRKEAERPL